MHVAWTAPSDTGSTAITAYDLRRIETSASDKADDNWTVVSDVWAVAGPLSGTVVHVDNSVQYDVQVRAANSRGDGAWSSTMTGTPADHADSRSSATVIALQTPTPGLISSSSDEDYFRFTLSEATGIFIYTTSYLSGFLSTTGELQNSSGSLIKSDDDDAGIRQHGGQLFLWDSLAAGTYYVKVGAPESGAYTLHTQVVPDGSTVEDAVDINLGESIGGILDTLSDDEDFFRLELAQRADVFIKIARANAGLDPLGTLLDEEGNVLEVHDDSFLEGDRKRHFLLRRELDAGVYFLKVNPAPEATYDVCRGFVPQYQSRSFVNCGDTESKSAATTGGPYVVSVEEAPRPGSSISSAREIPIDGNVLTAGRSRRSLESIGLALDDAAIPAGQPSTAGLSGDEDGEAILRLLRWLQNPRDEQSARRVFHYLKPSLSDLFGESVRSGLRKGLPLEAALADTPDGEQGDQVRELLACLSQWRLLSRDTGRLIASLRNDLPNLFEDSDKASGALMVLRTMETLLREVSNAPHTRLADFLIGLPVVVATNAHQETVETGAVSLLTLHQAKGLEFTSVFLIGLVDGIIPDFRSAKKDRTLEEERRLCQTPGLCTSR